MIELRSYLCGEWRAGEGREATLVDPTTAEPVAMTSTKGSTSLARSRTAGRTAGRRSVR